MCKKCRATEKGIKDDFVCDGCIMKGKKYD